MKIRRDNYELYSINYIDGKLSPVEVATFMAFLQENPDIAEEIAMLRNTAPTINPELKKSTFNHLKKDISKIEINETNFEEKCIAYHEGDLDKNSGRELLNYIAKNPIKKEEFDLYGKLKLTPNDNVYFANKKTLKHALGYGLTLRRVAVITSLAAAASLAILFTIRVSQTTNSKESIDIRIAQKTTVTETEKVKDNKSDQKLELNTEKEVLTEKIFIQEGAGSVSIVESNNRQMMAVVDTTHEDKDGFIRISRIETNSIESNLKDPITYLDLKNNIANSSSNEGTGKKVEFNQLKNVVPVFLPKLTANNLIRTGIEGINKMAETNLSFTSETDEKGRITEFALSYENFNIKRKIKSN